MGLLNSQTDFVFYYKKIFKKRKPFQIFNPKIQVPVSFT